MSWTRPVDLRRQVQRLWERGDLLASVVTGEPLFPRRLTLRGPSSQEMTDRFAEVRTWIGELRALPHYRVELREFRHRLFGANAVPDAVWIDSLDDALALIGKRRDASRFGALLELTRARQPRLLAWLAKRPLRALELADEWSRLLDIVTWLQAHPRPGVYLREVDIPGVHSKLAVSKGQPAVNCGAWVGRFPATCLAGSPQGTMPGSALLESVSWPCRKPRDTALPIPTIDTTLRLIKEYPLIVRNGRTHLAARLFCDSPDQRRQSLTTDRRDVWRSRSSRFVPCRLADLGRRAGSIDS